MSTIKKLAGQTAIYGLSSIVGRFINYLLVPLHTARFIPSEYGVITELYAYVAFLTVLLLYGMETSFFRFSTKADIDKKDVFSTSLSVVAITTAIFLLLESLFNTQIANALEYNGHTNYIIWMAITLAADALTAIPLANLRQTQRPLKFAFVNLLPIAINVLLSMYWIGWCMQPEVANNPEAFKPFFNPELGVGYVFLAGMIASLSKFVLVTMDYKSFTLALNKTLLGAMLAYAWPLLIAGFAGIINETLDRSLLRMILSPQIGELAAREQLGIYGACYKLSIIISLFIQAFRYAAEPFFFSKFNDLDAKQQYARVTTYFSIIVFWVFLFVMFYLDIFKYFIRKEAYWVGLDIVPILLMAYIFLGTYYNLSVWYKLTDKTRYGAAISIVGALITVVLNVWLIPTIGFRGSAWATFAAYGIMMLLSYALGQKFYPIHYNLKKIGGYFTFGAFLFLISLQLQHTEIWLKLGINTLLLMAFTAVIAYFEQPLKLIFPSKK